MADFFGGILDDLQGYAKDVGSFFDSTMGQAAAQAVKAGYSKEESTTSGEQAKYIDSGPAKVTKGSAITSEDFSASELEWLARMKRFANLDTGTDVKIGSN